MSSLKTLLDKLYTDRTDRLGINVSIMRDEFTEKPSYIAYCSYKGNTAKGIGLVPEEAVDALMESLATKEARTKQKLNL